MVVIQSCARLNGNGRLPELERFPCSAFFPPNDLFSMWKLLLGTFELNYGKKKNVAEMLCLRINGKHLFLHSIVVSNGVHMTVNEMIILTLYTHFLPLVYSKKCWTRWPLLSEPFDTLNEAHSFNSLRQLRAE